MAAVGLRREDAHPELPPQPVSTGLATLIAPVADAAAVSRARKDEAAVAALAGGAFNLYLCAIDGGTARARSFPTELEGEDPATGSAAGPLLAYAHERRGIERLDVTQGVEIGRPSRLIVELENERVRVGGDVVVLVTGTLRLP
jgi:trans-2,3-dihydro-3-hydroxyanthranilate isomerase